MFQFASADNFFAQYLFIENTLRVFISLLTPVNHFFAHYSQNTLRVGFFNAKTRTSMSTQRVGKLVGGKVECRIFNTCANSIQISFATFVLCDAYTFNKVVHRHMKIAP